ncbi:MAG: serine/threonine protein kinase [Anaerolineae bacterium]
MQTTTRDEQQHIWIVQILGWLTVIVSLVLVLVNIPIFYAYVWQNTSDPYNPFVIAWLRTLLRRFGELVYFTLAIGILLRSKEPLAILLAMFSAVLGATYGGSYIEIVNQSHAVLLFISTIVASLPAPLGILLLFVLPDGYFVPESGRWWALVIAIYEPIRIYFSVNGTNLVVSYSLLIPVLLVLIIGIAAQLNRYSAGSPIYRQQFKWVIVGTVSLMLSLALLIIGLFTLPANLHIFAQGLDEVGGTILGLTLLIAVTRYHLYDIDLFINQALVYGGAMLVSGLVILTGYAVLHNPVFSLAPVVQLVGLALLTALMLVALHPLARLFQRWVDRQIYGLRFDLNQLNTYTNTTAPAIVRVGAYKAQTIGDYQLLSTLGQSSLSEVYLARRDQRMFALKMLTHSRRYNGLARQRLATEAQIIQQLDHPGVVQLYEQELLDSHMYLVLSYVEGQSLSDYLRAHECLTPELAYPILQTLAQTLDYVHEAGFIHRDIKPDNIIVRPDGQTVLLDFGLAVALHDLVDSPDDLPAIGTIAYMAPEQIQNGNRVNRRADIYSLGVLTYQLLCGQLPFSGGKGRMLFGHLNQPAPDLRECQPHLPASIAQAVQQAMAKAPAERFDSAGAFLQALRS